MPSAAGSGSYHAAVSQRSGGIGPTASRPSDRNLQSSSGLPIPPGRRHPTPTIAIGDASAPESLAAEATLSSAP
ncbi:hypothetical protein BE17_12475 [Sorangium cellulosum]|uniref:Uncharacterized protein n=1 Tax=Sorangium cellulosum TaxID=56 RepID=A0A150SM57_SORCE|nr:hypothetical protein BE17_12475 [Sorangium cellulosum]